MKNFSFLLLLSLPSILFSQITFEKTYEGLGFAETYAVQQTQDDGYIVVGFTRPIGGSQDQEDYYVVKTDEYGDSLWTRRYGGNEKDRATAVLETSEGYYIIVGYSQSFVQNEIRVYMIKIDTNGDSLWARTYGTVNRDDGYAMAHTSDENYVMAGTIDHDLGLIKINAAGDTIWTKSYGTQNFDFARSVKQTSDGGYIAAGVASISGSKIYLIKTDENGFITGMHDSKNNVFNNFLLLQNYPNPFNPVTTIKFYLPKNSVVSLKIYNILGEEITTLISAPLLSGFHRYQWDATKFASGIYLYQLQAQNYTETKKMFLIK